MDVAAEVVEDRSFLELARHSQVFRSSPNASAISSRVLLRRPVDINPEQLSTAQSPRPFINVLQVLDLVTVKEIVSVMARPNLHRGDLLRSSRFAFARRRSDLGW